MPRSVRSWSRNHSRSWACESGAGPVSGRGVMVWRWAGRDPPEAWRACCRRFSRALRCEPESSGWETRVLVSLTKLPGEVGMDGFRFGIGGGADVLHEGVFNNGGQFGDGGRLKGMAQRQL